MSDNRSIVAISRIVGKELNSSGDLMNRAVIRTRTENVIEIARLMSRSHLGIGRIRMTRIATIPSASPISPRRRIANISPMACAGALDPDAPDAAPPDSGAALVALTGAGPGAGAGAPPFVVVSSLIWFAINL